MWYEDKDKPGERRTLTPQEKADPASIAATGRLFTTLPCHSSQTSSTGRSEDFYLHKGSGSCPEHPTACDDHACTKECDAPNNNCPLGKKCGPRCQATVYRCPPTSHWRVSHRGLHTLAQMGRLNEGNNIQWKHYEDEVLGRSLNAIWENSGVIADKQYVVETPPKVLERCLLMTTDPGDLVLDLTCGSGAMPFQAETWGRRWIAVDVAQVSIAIARERLITNTYPYHMLKDSPQGAKLDHEMEQALLPTEERAPFGGDSRRRIQVRSPKRVRGRTATQDFRRHPSLWTWRRRTHQAPRPDGEGQQPDQGRLSFHRRVRFPIPVNDPGGGKRTPAGRRRGNHPPDDRIHPPGARRPEPRGQEDHR